MDYLATLQGAFLDELEKIAASRGRMHIPKERVGRRSISVSKFLKKDNEGKLFKKAGVVPIQLDPRDPGEAVLPKKKGEMPSKDDFDTVSRMDGRDNTVTTSGLGSTFNNIASLGNSSGGT